MKQIYNIGSEIYLQFTKFKDDPIKITINSPVSHPLFFKVVNPSSNLMFGIISTLWDLYPTSE